MLVVQLHCQFSTHRFDERCTGGSMFVGCVVAGAVVLASGGAKARGVSSHHEP